MPTHGNDGVVKVNTGSAVAVGEIQRFSYEESQAVAESGAMGDTYEDFLGGLKAWRGDCTVWWDPSDAGQTALTVGAEVTMEFYPQGDASADKYRSGTALVENVGVTSDKGSVVEQTFTFRGKGALSSATVV